MIEKTHETRSAWFHDAKWGVFAHYLAEVAGYKGDLALTPAEWDRRIDAFDVEALARQLVEAQAGYCCITLGQNSGYYLSPNATYDALVQHHPSRCSRRDLLADLIAVLTPLGIRTMVYLGCSAPASDRQAIERLKCTPPWGGGLLGLVPGSYTVQDGMDERLTEFQRNWEAVIREWSLRWGKGLSGWWFDGCYGADRMYRNPDAPNFGSFAAAAKAGNPDSLVAWNPGVVYPPYAIAPEEDYTAGEVNEFDEVDCPGRWEHQAQFHILSYLGVTWGLLPIRFSPAQAVSHTLDVTSYGGVVTWDVPLTGGGLIAPEAMPALREIGQAVGATRGQADRLPLPLLRPVVSFPESPVVGRAAPAKGLLRVALKNHLSIRAQGKLELSVEPAGAVRFDVDPHLAHDLAPGAESHLDIVFEVLDGAKAAVVLTRDGDGRAMRYPIPMRPYCALPRLAVCPELDRLAQALAGFPVRPLITPSGHCLGDVCLAVADGKLLLSCRIRDTIRRWTPSIWDGSCLEVFGVAEAGDRIRQLFLQPASADGGDRAWLWDTDPAQANVRAVQAPEIAFRSWPTPEGYLVAASIPLTWWLCRSQAPSRFFVELAVNAGIGAQRFGRAALFGSLDASSRSASYASADAAL